MSGVEIPTQNEKGIEPSRSNVKGHVSTPLTYEGRQALKQDVSNGRKKQRRREARLDLFGNDPQLTGEAILQHAAMYRQEHPDAKLSECVDDWLEKQQKVHGSRKHVKLHGPDSAKFFDTHPADAYASGLDSNGDADNPLETGKQM